MTKIKFLIFQMVIAILMPATIAAMAQDMPSAYAEGSCLDASSRRMRPPAYCGDAQRLYDKLTYHSKTAIVGLKQLKNLLFEEHSDPAMWQFLALNLAEKSPYFASGARKRDLADEIRQTLDSKGRSDQIFGFAADILYLRGAGDKDSASADTLAGLTSRAEQLRAGETDAQLLVALGHASIGLGQLQVQARDFDNTLKTLSVCSDIFEKSGSRLLPQSCYAQLNLSGGEPADFLARIAEAEEKLTCGRDLTSLCNLFRKNGHGQYLAAAPAN